jgi:NADPH2 dehydrogenase
LQLLQIVDAVHAKGSFIYLQLWSLGRSANPSQLKKEDPTFCYLSSSPIALTGKAVTPSPSSTAIVPRTMTIPEIEEYVHLYATAASNAILKAGLDGVEIHAASCYLVDHFLQDVTNQRTGQSLHWI